MLVGAVQSVRTKHNMWHTDTLKHGGETHVAHLKVISPPYYWISTLDVGLSYTGMFTFILHRYDYTGMFTHPARFFQPFFLLSWVFYKLHDIAVTRTLQSSCVKELQPDTDEYSFVSNDESPAFLKVCCSHIALAKDFIQALNEVQRFWPINLVFTHFCCLLLFLRY